MKILNVVGARPNFMKIAPLLREMRRYRALEPLLVHTGQHYDVEMSRVFFEELELPRPDVDLEVGSGTHAWQTAQVMLRFDPVLEEFRPDLVIVVGDVNSTLACALVAAKRLVPVAHVEAGLRSFDRTMPEEINRLLTDALAGFLFTTSPEAADHLQREGIPAERIFFVGNVMVDTLLRHRERAERSTIRRTLEIEETPYALITLHRPSNVDDVVALGRLVEVLGQIGRALPVIFPAHPRTIKRLTDAGLAGQLVDRNIRLLEPLGYLDFLHLMGHARMVLTDSGGVQEETTVLGIPCLTLRANTERPVTITDGTNTLVGTDPQRIMSEVDRILHGHGKAGRLPPLWDGQAAQRIIAVIAQHFRLALA